MPIAISKVQESDVMARVKEMQCMPPDIFREGIIAYLYGIPEITIILIKY